MNGLSTVAGFTCDGPFDKNMLELTREGLGMWRQVSMLAR